MKLSVISPVYNAAPVVPELVRRLKQVLNSTGMTYEVLLVNDGSSDDSWLEIINLLPENPFLKAIDLSRNFGQHSAILAGLEKADGDFFIVMDCDLQDDPEDIIQLLKAQKDGFDIVYTVKRSRKHGLFKNIATSVFNRIFNYLIDNKNLAGSDYIGSYTLINRRVRDAFIGFNDYQFHFLQVLRWLGFRTTSIRVDHHDRFKGQSSYTLSKLINHALVAILYQSDKLLRINIMAGFVISFTSFISGLFIIAMKLLFGFQPGWTSLIVLILFSTGLILTSIGVVGLYVAKSFEQVKGRPRYIIRETRSA